MSDRSGLAQIVFKDDPEFKRVVQMECLKLGQPMGAIIRKLLREWLISRKVKFPTDRISKEGVANA
jgi:hypothetical protein